MKRFFYKAAAFGFLLLLGMVGLDILIATIEKQMYKSLYEGRNAELLIMGNSRAYLHVSPQILDSVMGGNSYNLGVNAARMEEQLDRYETYLQYNAKPKCIVQNIDFYHTLGKTNTIYRVYSPFLIPPSARMPFRDPVSLKDYFSLSHFPLYNRIWNDRDIEKETLATKGVKLVDRQWEGLSLINSKTDSAFFDYNEQVEELFVRYVEQMKKDSIRLVFVYAPVYKGGMEVLGRADSLHCYGLFDSIAKAYEVPILDYTDCYLSQDTAYFYNAMHLNRDGAERYSTMLAQDLDSLGIMSSEASNRYFYFRREE